jgi:hypothetical protein
MLFRGSGRSIAAKRIVALATVLGVTLTMASCLTHIVVSGAPLDAGLLTVTDGGETEDGGTDRDSSSGDGGPSCLGDIASLPYTGASLV